ncbi:MAG TPA: phosphate ABC transporter ATP-binding protein [Gemmatimonadales bacterium]|nr:phosphate ABC transporter ATP-binding protein [Gemmatimonadales bacterium]
MTALPRVERAEVRIRGEPGRGEASTHLAMEALTVRYRGRTAVDRVSLAIRAGRITTLVGPSGCGKTTLLRCLNRLIDLVPGATVSGAVQLGSLDVLAPETDVVALRRRVGMIFQQPNPFPMSVRRNLELPLREHGVGDRAEREARAEEALRAVGLWEEIKDRLGASARELSGGQQQRLCIARALVLRPEVLLMDEPCSALDPIASGVVEDLITSFRGRLTVVVVTHQLAQARRNGDDAALLWLRDGAGSLVEAAPTDRFFHAPESPVTASYVAGRRG